MPEKLHHRQFGGTVCCSYGLINPGVVHANSELRSHVFVTLVYHTLQPVSSRKGNEVANRARPSYCDIVVVVYQQRPEPAARRDGMRHRVAGGGEYRLDGLATHAAFGRWIDGYFPA